MIRLTRLATAITPLERPIDGARCAGMGSVGGGASGGSGSVGSSAALTVGVVVTAGAGGARSAPGLLGPRPAAVSTGVGWGAWLRAAPEKPEAGSPAGAPVGSVAGPGRGPAAEPVAAWRSPSGAGARSRDPLVGCWWRSRAGRREGCRVPPGGGEGLRCRRQPVRRWCCPVRRWGRRPVRRWGRWGRAVVGDRQPVRRSRRRRGGADGRRRGRVHPGRRSLRLAPHPTPDATGREQHEESARDRRQPRRDGAVGGGAHLQVAGRAEEAACRSAHSRVHGELTRPRDLRVHRHLTTTERRDLLDVDRVDPQP